MLVAKRQTDVCFHMYMKACQFASVRHGEKMYDKAHRTQHVHLIYLDPALFFGVQDLFLFYIGIFCSLGLIHLGHRLSRCCYTCCCSSTDLVPHLWTDWLADTKPLCGSTESFGGPRVTPGNGTNLLKTNPVAKPANLITVVLIIDENALTF